VQSGLKNLHRRELIATTLTHPTASPRHRVRRPWRRRWQKSGKRRARQR
jgi:hypothetical protein